MGGGGSNDGDYGDADDNVVGDDDDDDHAEEEEEEALAWLQFADFVLNVAQVDRDKEDEKEGCHMKRSFVSISGGVLIELIWAV